MPLLYNASTFCMTLLFDILLQTKITNIIFVCNVYCVSIVIGTLAHGFFMKRMIFRPFL